MITNIRNSKKIFNEKKGFETLKIDHLLAVIIQTKNKYRTDVMNCVVKKEYFKKGHRKYVSFRTNKEK